MQGNSKSPSRSPSISPSVRHPPTPHLLKAPPPTSRSRSPSLARSRSPSLAPSRSPSVAYDQSYAHPHNTVYALSEGGESPLTGRRGGDATPTSQGQGYSTKPRQFSMSHPGGGLGEGGQSSRAPWKPSSPPILTVDKIASFGRTGSRRHLPSYASNMNMALLDEGAIHTPYQYTPYQYTHSQYTHPCNTHILSIHIPS